MPSQNPQIRRLVAQNAIQARHHGTDAPQAQEARRALAEARLAEHIERVVAAAPPLTDAQRERLAALLRPAARAVATAS